MKFDRSQIPSYAVKVARILINEGFDCYLVGGAVRDNLLGIRIKDIDGRSAAEMTNSEDIQRVDLSLSCS